MSDLRELYQEIILDHGRHPRNFGACPTATHHKEGFNPLCGDKILLHITERNGIIEKIMFEGSGCAISMASASLMSECLVGKKFEEVESLFSAFHEVVTNHDASLEAKENLGKLAVLSGVSEFPARVKCATLAWHTFRAAIENNAAAISTEEMT